MKEIYETFLKFFFVDFTWRKLCGLVAVILLAVLVFLAYEHYTSSFRFSRLQRATELIASLQELQTHVTNSTPDLDRARKIIVTQTIQAIENKPISLDFFPSKLTVTREGLWKFAAAGALLFVFALFQISKLEAKVGKGGIINLIVISAVTGLVGVAVPPIWWPWFHLLVLPLVFLFLVILPFALAISAMPAAKKKAQSIACVNNLKQIGLAARRWAENHQGVLPSDFASLKAGISDGLVTHCSSDDGAQYEIISPGRNDSDISAVYARCPIHNNMVLIDGSVRQSGQIK